MCEDLLNTLVAGDALSVDQRAHAATCIRCTAALRAVGTPAPMRDGPALVVTPAALRRQAVRRAVPRVGLVAAAAAALVMVAFRSSVVPAAAPVPPDLVGLWTEVDAPSAFDLPGTEPLSALQPLADPLSDLPFTPADNPWRIE